MERSPGSRRVSETRKEGESLLSLLLEKSGGKLKKKSSQMPSFLRATS